MAAGEEDLASVAARAEERLKTLESAVLKEREELKARVSELEAELEKLRYRVECLGRSLKEGDAAARRALEEVDKEGGDREGGKLRSRLGRVLFGKYYCEEGDQERSGQ